MKRMLILPLIILKITSSNCQNYVLLCTFQNIKITHKKALKVLTMWKKKQDWKLLLVMDRDGNLFETYWICYRLKRLKNFRAKHTFDPFEIWTIIEWIAQHLTQVPTTKMLSLVGPLRASLIAFKKTFLNLSVKATLG